MAPEFLTPASTKWRNRRKRHLTAPWPGSQPAALQNFSFLKNFLLLIKNLSRCVFSRRKPGVSNPLLLLHKFFLLHWLCFGFSSIKNVFANCVNLWGTNYFTSLHWILVRNFVYNKHFKLLIYSLNHHLIPPLSFIISKTRFFAYFCKCFFLFVYDINLYVTSLFLQLFLNRSRRCPKSTISEHFPSSWGSVITLSTSKILLKTLCDFHAFQHSVNHPFEVQCIASVVSFFFKHISPWNFRIIVVFPVTHLQQQSSSAGPWETEINWDRGRDGNISIENLLSKLKDGL